MALVIVISIEAHPADGIGTVSTRIPLFFQIFATPTFITFPQLIADSGLIPRRPGCEKGLDTHDGNDGFARQNVSGTAEP